MDKIISVAQFIVSILMLSCTLVWSIIQIVSGHITSIYGILFILFFLLIEMKLIQLSYRELTE